MEISQIKGSSETRPSLSPTDEWANFEIVDGIIGQPDMKSTPAGSYVRRAFLDGLEMQNEKGINPYKFGVIAATDSHNASVPSDENNYTGKVGIADDTAPHRRTGETGGLISRTYSAAGLAGVWSEENTREGIFDALARKETFATSGPRIKVRMFAGWDFNDNTITQPNWADIGYAEGVHMGMEMREATAEGAIPGLLISTQKDPNEAPLQRVQVIKGWIENGEQHEKVFDAACSDNLSVDPKTNRCPSNGAIVDTKTCAISPDVGDVSFATVWQDPEFNANQHAFYYVRVLQNPTCRWSTWDALRNNWPLLEDVPATIQERAWSSAVWYRPTSR